MSQLFTFQTCVTSKKQSSVTTFGLPIHYSVYITTNKNIQAAGFIVVCCKVKPHCHGVRIFSMDWNPHNLVD